VEVSSDDGERDLGSFRLPRGVVSFRLLVSCRGRSLIPTVVRWSRSSG
jgi:hypothetical protein